VSTAPADNNDGGDEQSTAPEGRGFELPLPEGSAGEARRLRRRPFGFRARDVRTAISARDAEITELRRDVAALWLAFGQHERTIREVLATLRRTSGVSIDPPGGRGDRLPAEGGAEGLAPAPDTEPATASSAEEIGAQLTDLDHVLAAIEQATETLERGYSEELNALEEDAEGEANADEEAGDPGPERPADSG
jgi:hypothetical protein